MKVLSEVDDDKERVDNLSGKHSPDLKEPQDVRHGGARVVLHR